MEYPCGRSKQFDRLVLNVKEAAFLQAHDGRIVHFMKLTDSIVTCLTTMLNQFFPELHHRLAVEIVGVDLKGYEAKCFE